MFGHLDFVAEVPACNLYRCSLCDSLGKNYGLLARFLTNYDVSLCALVVLEPSVVTYQVHRTTCPMFSRHEVFGGRVNVVEFLAAVTVVLSAEKVKDDAYDEGQSPTRFAIRWLRKQRGRAEEVLRRSSFDPESMTKAFDEQRLLEERRREPTHHYSRPSAEVMGAVYAHAAMLAGTVDVGPYRTIGQAVGEIVYFCDSVADYQDDLHHRRFTPFFSCDRSSSRSTGSLPESMREEVGMFFTEALERIRISLAMTPSSSLTHELLVNRLQGKIAETLAFHPDARLTTASRLFAGLAEISPLTLLFFPRMAFAGNGRSASGGCIEALLPLGIMLFVMNAVMKKCVGQGICGRRGPDKVTVDDGCCGGKKTYTRDPCSGRYRKDGC